MLKAYNILQPTQVKESHTHNLIYVQPGTGPGNKLYNLYVFQNVYILRIVECIK